MTDSRHLEKSKNRHILATVGPWINNRLDRSAWNLAWWRIWPS